MASNDSTGIQPFHEFQASLGRDGSGGKLAGPVTAQAMQEHLLDHYKGVEARHSFEDENGSVFDCVPVEQQPSVRNSGETPPKAPDLPHLAHAATATTGMPGKSTPIEPLQPGKHDRHGNEMFAPEGTIPIRRLTPANLARFGTLENFFQKSPFGSGRPPGKGRSAGAGSEAPSVPATHRWAHAAQNVQNVGGHSYLNVWDPPIGANQVFSLSQHWYVGGSGGALQTAEVGWQVYPQKYGSTKPVFFIYWTADDYQKTGNYNLDKSAFVQTNKNWAIGGTLSPSSIAGGQQYEIQVAYFLFQGRWWLYIGGEAGSNAIGYYPASLYQGGALATRAAEIDYGGETVGTVSFPPMGSGAKASTGWQHAAYQRDIRYYPPGGGTANASLTGSSTMPTEYTETVEKFGAPWNETIYFGGPGGP